MSAESIAATSINAVSTGDLEADKRSVDAIIALISWPETDLTEAKILSDSRNLDDMGAVGIYNEFRRDVIGGKGVSDIMESWKRKVDYRYWQARLKESFRFETVRKIAVQRFAATEYIMNQLKIENAAQDLEDVLLESLDYTPQAAGY